MTAYLFNGIDLPTYKELRASSAHPSIHGNGFIQIELLTGDDIEYRLHVWHHEVPRQTVPSMIHDHRFGFTSTVHYGRVANLIYGTQTPPPSGHGAWQAWQAVPQLHARNTRLERARSPSFDIYLQSASMCAAGDSYDMHPFGFHETAVLEPSVTVISKWYPKSAEDHVLARVLLPRGVEPDYDFRREDQSQKLAWAIIEEMLKKCRSH